MAIRKMMSEADKKKFEEEIIKNMRLSIKGKEREFSLMRS